MFGLLATPLSALIGLLLGTAVAAGAWFVMPETMNREAVCGWIVGLGFVAGLLWGIRSRR